ncbi:MAG: hypothetical protein GC168_18075 [Candidatus Hydrogenedens sp.]|nr:hypothetical protein [Candidatus Hydrogenedens sp.]
MSDTQEEFEVLASGFIDGELDDTQRRRLEALLAEAPSRQHELDALRRIASGTTALLRPDEPPDADFDTFLDDVYNRMERSTGWWILVLGAVALGVYGVFAFVTEPWGPAFLKVLVATPVAGLGILFLSVLRNRLHTLKTDRYEREVHR